MTAGAPALERTAYWLLVACLGLTQFNLLTAQTLFGVAALLWLIVVGGERGRLRAPAFFLPLAVYAILTVISAAVSPDRARSLTDCKQLVLFLIVPMVTTLARGDRATRVIDVLIALGAAAAMVGVVQYLMFGFEDLSHRPVGPLSHYMTYSGVLMLVTCAAIARLLFFPREIVWPAVAVPALLAALAFTLTRNAWVGTAAAISVLLALRNWRLLLALPIVAAAVALVVLVVAPGAIRDRAASMGDLNDPSTRDRYDMMEIGRKMIAAHPLAGVGPDMVERVYPQYRPPNAVHPTNPHLHNVPLQIAAERGLPALAAWLWFIVVAARDLLRLLRRGRYRAVSAAGLAAIVAMLTAGLFEYNFGDSEFLMLFLGLIALPFAAETDEAAGPGLRAPGRA